MVPLRVPLWVPCDDADTVAAASGSGADALVLDLGGDGPPERRARARGVALLSLERPGRAMPLIVRVGSLAGGLLAADLAAVMAGAPDAVLLPGAVGAVDLQHLAAKLAVCEAERGLVSGSTRIVAMPADTARGVLALSSLQRAGPRLAAVGWDPAALSRDLGAGAAAAAAAVPCRVARGLLLLAAAAARVPAFDGAAPDAVLARDCRAARRDGFSGKLALAAGQVPRLRAALASGRVLVPTP